MSQINYKLETLRLMTNGKCHIRKIAAKLNTNAMAITRIMNSLLKENAVDFIVEGRNKTFFLKNTIEARNLLYQAENYALLRTLESYPNLRRIIEKLQKDKRIKLAILFGSYAKGLAKRDSDIDIFIETNNLTLKKELNLIDSKLSIKMGKLNKDNLLVKEIEKNHIIIKGVETYYEKSNILKKAV